MMEMYSRGYTLWLMPTSQANEKFVSLVKKLAAENQAPIFQPHVTLLGDIIISEQEAIEKTKQLVSGQTPFTLNLAEIGYEDFHFRTLFVRAEKTEPLLDLHNRAKEIFQKQDIPPYMPHLSILYGIYPTKIKEKIIAEIGRNQSSRFEVKSIHLVKGGEVADWKITAELPFCSTDPGSE